MSLLFTVPTPYGHLASAYLYWVLSYSKEKQSVPIDVKRCFSKVSNSGNRVIASIISENISPRFKSLKLNMCESFNCNVKIAHDNRCAI